MASHALALLALGRLLISDVSCVSITVESTMEKMSQVMRSEKKHVKDSIEMELQASGALHMARSSTAMDMCALDFPLGVEGSCKCRDEENHTNINEEEECLEAASQAGVTAPIMTFRLNADWYHYHPRGCFKQTCDTSTDPKGICYFFNPIGDEPAQCLNQTTLADGKPAPAVTGVPICKRPKYANGTLNTNAGCPDEYGNILNEKNCTAAAVCLGFTPGTEIRVTAQNQSEHDDFPRGCFVDSNDGFVYYNPELANWELPKHPRGRPLCNATMNTFFNGAETHSGVNMTERATEATTVNTSALLKMALEVHAKPAI